MLAKLVMIVLALALTAASLLAVRQQRLQAVSEMATAVERAGALERRTWRVRIEIARLTAPDELRRVLEERGEFRPMRVEWCEVLYPGDDQAGRGHGG